VSGRGTKLSFKFAFRNSLGILDRTDRVKIALLVIVQIALSLLDLIGVALIGILGALAVNGVASRQPGSRVYSVLNFVGLENQNLQVQAAVIAIAATLLLIGKTILSVILVRKTTFYLSRRGARISALLLSKLLNQPLTNLNLDSSQTKLYSVGSGVNTIVVGILSAGVTLIADLSLLIVMLLGLFVVDFAIAISSLVIFSLVGFLLFLVMNKRAAKLGEIQAKMSISYNQSVLEVLGTYRENFVHNRRSFYSEKLARNRLAIADFNAEFSLMPNVSKYVLEATVILTAIFVSGIQFSIHDAARAVAILSVFLAASTRISPAVLRIQQGLIGIKNAIGSSHLTFQLIDSLKRVDALPPHTELTDKSHLGFDAKVSASHLTFKYPNSTHSAITNLDFEIEPGESIAIVGASGAGKTSLVDTILGLHIPTSGSVKISGLSPSDAITAWPGAISYVPQDILILDGTIRENVALGYPMEIVSDEDVWAALGNALLSEFVNALPKKLDSHVGDRGVNLSGGQRQRLGIARALFTKPKLLILDEATSSLDGKTESAVSQAIQAMHGEVTVITIAHRLSTVKNADRVFYLENGHLVAKGTFLEVRKLVPDFDEQAKLMGL
jgi:ABC-type multidrug transport system fused ATPase/permease subunit